jgi:recombinational DNA repair protein RecR
MAYTPEISMKSSSTLRRISWSLGIPMTKCMEYIFEYLPKILDKEKVCQGCRDKTKCESCAFNSHNQTQQKKEVIA